MASGRRRRRTIRRDGRRRLRSRRSPSGWRAPDPETFEQRFDLLTLSRKGKDYALYRYAAAELGDRRYLRFLPHTRRVLQAAAQRVAARDPHFGELRDQIAALPESTCGR